MSSQEVVNIATFNNVIDANVARIALEGEGIPCVVIHPNQGAYPLPIVTVSIQVFRDDVEDARQILKDQQII